MQNITNERRTEKLSRLQSRGHIILKFKSDKSKNNLGNEDEDWMIF